MRRRFPIGAEVIDEDRVHVRVWAPNATRVRVEVVGRATTELDRADDGYFSGLIEARAGDRYGFRLDDDEMLYPDPVSRFQPEGPHRPSEIVDPSTFRWTDGSWRGVALDRQVIYEMHLGTFTRDGTWAAAAHELPELAKLGVTLVEVLPIAEFDGRFGWGYDGVDMFAPSHLYGRPDDVRSFVDAAHDAGVGIMLDIVPNHFGPSGNYLRKFSATYSTNKYANEWGEAINFDGPGSAPVREFFETLAAYWIREFHLDGLRLDATQQVFDDSDEHILTAMGKAARAAADERTIVLVAENETQHAKLVRPIAEGGYGLDGLWNDDFHHSAMVALTGHAEAYYSDTRGEPQEFISAAKYGYLFQGQHYHWQGDSRGSAAWGVSSSSFVTFLQNHDQVANSAHGLRGDRLTSPGRWRAMTALLLLGPGTPMLFQGQEFSSSAPFLYFADFDPELNAAVREGRKQFLSQFSSVVDATRQGVLDDPSAMETFERCRLDFGDRKANAGIYALHQELLRLRRSTAAFRDRGGVDGAVLSSQAFALRFFTPNHSDDRVLVVNLGAGLRRTSIAEPLLAPPANCEWIVDWCSEDANYGGPGTPEIVSPDGHWMFPGESAVVFAPAAAAQPRRCEEFGKR